MIYWHANRVAIVHVVSAARIFSTRSLQTAGAGRREWRTPERQTTPEKDGPQRLLPAMRGNIWALSLPLLPSKRSEPIARA
jgi:hypothetical protein